MSKEKIDENKQYKNKEEIMREAYLKLYPHLKVNDEGFDNYKRNSYRVIPKIEHVFDINLDMYKTQNGVFQIPKPVADLFVDVLVAVTKSKLIKSGVYNPDKMDLNKQKSFNREISSIIEKSTGKESLPSYKEILSHSSGYNSGPIYNVKAYLELDVDLKEPFVQGISNIEEITSEINDSVKEFAKQLKNIPKKNTPKVDNNTEKTNEMIEENEDYEKCFEDYEDYINCMSRITPRDTLALINLLDHFLNEILWKWESVIEEFKTVKKDIVEDMVYEYGDIFLDDNSKEILDELLPENIIACLQDWENE